MAMNIGIVGLGLIGGSMAKAISAKTSHSVTGFDRDQDALSEAGKSGAISGTLDADSIGSCDVIIVALYPKDAIEYVSEHAGRIKTDAVVVDCCGVKRAVCTPLERVAADHGFAFIGGHPMAGTENWGFGASRANLFEGASMILTPNDTTPAWAADRVSALFLAIGFGRIVRSTPQEHDFLISYTSQLAHAVSCAYIGSDSATRSMGFSAGSFRDMTRVARLNEHMWTDLFLHNADYLSDEIESMVGRLLDLRAALVCGDREELLEMLKRGRERKEFVSSGFDKKGEPA
jgi:prephenate dehydrogenase